MSGVISGRLVKPLVPDNHVKFVDLHLQTVLEKFHLKASEAAFRRFLHSSFQPEVDNNDMSGANVVRVGVDVPVKLGDSSSNDSRDI